MTCRSISDCMPKRAKDTRCQWRSPSMLSSNRHARASLRHGALFGVAVLLGFGVTTAQAVDVFVTANANISTLVTVDDTVLIWTGTHTVTVDATTTKTLAGVNAGGFTATIDFTAADRKVLLGNSSGNVVFQTGGGEIRAIGAGAGAQTAGFLVPANVTGETVEIRAAVDDTDNANHWIIGNNTLLLNDSSAQLGTVTIGSDGGVAKIDADQSATIKTITPTGDFTIDLALNRTLTITNSLNVGANTLTLLGAGSTSAIVATGGLVLDNAGSVLSVTGTATLDDLDISASSAITLADGVTLTLTDAVAIGANTLTINGTTGSSAETITATGGITLNNAASQLRVTGDSSNTLVISKVDITGTDLTTGRIDVDENTQIAALTVSQTATLDVASGKTLSGTATLNAAKTLTLSNAGTVDSLTTSTAAGTVQFTGQGTINTLTNSVAGTTVDVDESASITTFAVNQDITVDVLSGKVLTTTATVAAAKILTSIGAGTISTVTLNGSVAELNVMTLSGAVSTLNVNADAGVLDADVNCTITQCNMATGSGDLTVENASVTITSTGGFNVGNNELLITQAGGTISLVHLNGLNAELDVNVNTTITTLSVSSDCTVDVGSGTTLTTTATVPAGKVLKRVGTGTLTTVSLNGTAAELNMTANGTVSTVNVTANGGVIDVDETCTLSAINMTAGAGDLTLDVAGGKTRTGTIDVNDNRLTLAGTGVPGIITLDTDDGVLDVNANSSPKAINISGDVTMDLASSKTLTATVSIGSKTLTLTGSGTVSRVDAGSGSVIGNGTTTIGDLRLSLASNGTFTYGGSGSSTITTIANSTISTGGEFRKVGAGMLTIAAGGGSLFSKAAGVRMDIDEGGIIVGSSGSSHDITFDDDGDEITVASGATLTTFGKLTVEAAGSNVNLDAKAGSVINLRSSDGAETLTAAADNDFKLLGTVNIDGDDGDYTLEGAFTFQFGHVNVNGTGSLINITPSAMMLFAPGSVIDLNGGATFIVDGQNDDTPISLGTTDATGTFTIDRGISQNLTIENVSLSNAAYTSSSGGAAIDEVNLTGVSDEGGNVNWFMPAQVENDNGNENDNLNDNSNDGENDNDNINDEQAEETPTVSGNATVDDDGQATLSVVSVETGATGRVDVRNASGGSLVLTIADGNLRDDFAGIPGRAALPITIRIASNVSGPFAAVVQLCYTDELLNEAGLAEEELVLYAYQEPDGPWLLAGREGQYQGNSTPTDTVGDFGFDAESQCVWVVRDELSDFAAGFGLADQQPVDDGADGEADSEPQRPRLCGIFPIAYLSLTLMGLVGLKLRVRQGHRA